MRLDNFDLNLLIAFETLVGERSVTRAAARMNLTQSAMSAALKRLRQAFQDEILVQQGKTMVPTPHALALQPEISLRLTDLRGLISRKGHFDPAVSERQFKVAASDYITTVLLAPLMNALAETAPGLSLDIELPNTKTEFRLANGDLDLFLTPEAFVHPDHPYELVFEESHVVVGWTGNPALKGNLSCEQLAQLGHVGVSITGKDTFVEGQMREAGIERRIEVRVPSFQLAPFFLPGTMRISVMHERLAHLMTRQLPLIIRPLPIEVPRMREMAQYHVTREKDQGLEWLRNQISLQASKAVPAIH